MRLARTQKDLLAGREDPTYSTLPDWWSSCTGQLAAIRPAQDSQVPALAALPPWRQRHPSGAQRRCSRGRASTRRGGGVPIACRACRGGCPAAGGCCQVGHRPASNGGAGSAVAEMRSLSGPVLHLPGLQGPSALCLSVACAAPGQKLTLQRPPRSRRRRPSGRRKLPARQLCSPTPPLRRTVTSCGEPCARYLTCHACKPAGCPPAGCASVAAGLRAHRQRRRLMRDVHAGRLTRHARPALGWCRQTSCARRLRCSRPAQRRRRRRSRLQSAPSSCRRRACGGDLLWQSCPVRTSQPACCWHLVLLRKPAVPCCALLGIPAAGPFSDGAPGVQEAGSARAAEQAAVEAASQAQAALATAQQAAEAAWQARLDQAQEDQQAAEEQAAALEAALEEDSAAGAAHPPR